MDRRLIIVLLIGSVPDCYLIPLPCSNNCLQTSEHTCEVVPCIHGCKPGWHGNNCNKPCNQSCKNSTCYQEDGSCTGEHFSEPKTLRLSDNCLERESHNKCSCCASKYRGDNCETSCDRCKTRIYMGCNYMCTAGYYGTTCNQTCPESCEKGNEGKPVCKEEAGAVKCSNGCPPGKYGDLCDQSCRKVCKNTCMQSSGNCVDCFDGYYGDICDKPCDHCVDRKCFRNGSCVEDCVDNKNCTRPCPKNCKQFNNSQCDNSNGTALTCIHGCIDGFYGQTCEHACEKCITCNQNSGECFSTHDTADTAASGNIGAIIGGIIGAVVGIVVLLLCLLWKYKKLPECCRCFTPENNNGPTREEEDPTESGREQEQETNLGQNNTIPHGIVADRLQYFNSVQPHEEGKQLENSGTTTDRFVAPSGKDEAGPAQDEEDPSEIGGELEEILKTESGPAQDEEDPSEIGGELEALLKTESDTEVLKKKKTGY